MRVRELWWLWLCLGPMLGLWPWPAQAKLPREADLVAAVDGVRAQAAPAAVWRCVDQQGVITRVDLSESAPSHIIPWRALLQWVVAQGAMVLSWPGTAPLETQGLTLAFGADGAVHYLLGPRDDPKRPHLVLCREPLRLCGLRWPAAPEGEIAIVVESYDSDGWSVRAVQIRWADQVVACEGAP